MRCFKIIRIFFIIFVSMSAALFAAPVKIDGVKYYQGGLKGEYFSGLNFETSQLVRVDSTINFFYAEFQPHASMGADNFSIRWTGKLNVAESETYKFYTISDDGVRVWIGDALVIDDWKNRPNSTATRLDPVENSGSLKLDAGFHDIRVEFFESSGKAVMKMFWESGKLAKDVIFPEYLYNDIEEKEMEDVQKTFRYGEQEYLSFDLNPGGHTHLATYLQAGMEANLGFVRGNDVTVKKLLPPQQQYLIEQIGQEDPQDKTEGVIATKTIFGMDAAVPWKLHDQGGEKYLEMTFGIKSLDKGQMEDCATEVAVMNCDRTCDYVVSANYTLHYVEAPFSVSDFAQVSMDCNPKELVINKPNTVSVRIKTVNKTLKNFKTILSVPYKIQDNVIEILSYPEGFILSRHAHGDVVISQALIKEGDYQGEEPVVLSVTPSKNEPIQFPVFFPSGDYDKKFAPPAEWAASSDKVIENPSKINVSYRKDIAFDVISAPVATYDAYSGEPIMDISRAIRVTGLGAKTWNYKTIGYAILDLISRGGIGVVNAGDEFNGTEISIIFKEGKILSVNPESARVIFSKGPEDSRAFSSEDNIAAFDRENQLKRFQVSDLPSYISHLKSRGKTDRTSCSFCSKPLQDRDMSFFNVFTVDGESFIACCAHCGLNLLLKLEDNLKHAVCRDHDSQELIDATKAYFLITEQPVGCCVPSVLAFAGQEKALNYRAKYGGEVFSSSTHNNADIRSILGKYR